MSAGWVAASVRGRALCQRRIGLPRARLAARCNSLEEANSALAGTAYADELGSAAPGLAGAQRAVDATVLWHLRILAGWCPPFGSADVSLLASGFEIQNIVDHMLRMQGRAVLAPLDLGSLSTAWREVKACRTPRDVRLTLAQSSWGDPGTDDPAAVRIALTLDWAHRVREGIPEAAGWATAAADRLTRRSAATGAAAAFDTAATRVVQRFQRVQGQPVAEDEWRQTAEWWGRVERESSELVSRPPRGSATVVGVVGLLSSDGWRTKAALAVAASGGGDLEEVLGVVA